MAQKKTDEELLASLEALDTTNTPSKAAKASSRVSKPADDPLAELESLAALAKPSSRPNTPKLALSQPRNATPGSTPGNSARNSEDSKARANAPRKSGDSTRSYHQGLTPTSEEERLGEEAAERKVEEEKTDAAGGGWGGWWGGLTATASAAVKQAENAVKEIQKNEEAQKWTEQFKGRVGDLRGLGMYISSLIESHLLMSIRRRSPYSRPSHIREHYQHDSSTHFLPRTSPDTYHPRSHRLSVP